MGKLPPELLPKGVPPRLAALIVASFLRLAEQTAKSWNGHAMNPNFFKAEWAGTLHCLFRTTFRRTPDWRLQNMPNLGKIWRLHRRCRLSRLLQDQV
jgi:hypothetical protein